MKSSASGIVAFALVLAVAMSSAAAIEDTISLGKGSNQPIEIKSTKLTAKSSPAGVELTFDGKVELKQDDMMLSCDKMVVLYEEEKRLKTESGNSIKSQDKNIANSIKSAVGSGNVRIVKNELTAVAGKALFDSLKRTVTLVEEEPRVSQGPHSLSAPTITMYLDENRAELSGEVKGQLHTTGRKSGSNQPIDIISNKLTAKAITGGIELTFDGKVKLEQGDMALSCDKMTVSYEEEKRSKADPDTGKTNHKDMTNSIKSAVGTGSVSITRSEFKATAGKAVFDNVKRTVMLTEGPPRVKQGPHELSGPMITVYLDQKRAELSQGVKGRLLPTGKAATTGAGENHPTPSLTQSSDEPIDITANRLVAQGISNEAKLNFEGKVKLEQGDIILSCDRMVVLYEDGRRPAVMTENRVTDIENQGKGNSRDISNSIKSVVASGNVQIANTKLMATAGRAVFDSSRRMVTLTEGPPKLRQGPHTVTAPTITISLDENRAELTGEKENGLKGILNPEKQEKEK